MPAGGALFLEAPYGTPCCRPSTCMTSLQPAAHLCQHTTLTTHRILPRQIATRDAVFFIDPKPNTKP